MKKRLTTLTLSALMIASFGAASCNKKQDGASVTVDDVDFWQTYSTEKVLQDVKGIYDEFKFPAEVNISAIRGEEEASQIIMTTGDKRIDAYDLTVSDLTCGENKLAKENVKVYHEKYITVGAAKEYYHTNGMYPDCLVPFENVKKVGENCIEPNNNQGLYVSVEIPQDQAEGTYTGQLTVKIGDTIKTIPLNVSVEHGHITEETHFLSCFQVKWKMGEGELDFSNDMLDKYNRRLFDYRLGASNLLYRNEHTDYEIQLYAEYAVAYSKMPECSGWCIPGSYDTPKNYEYHGKFVPNADYRNPETMIKYVLAIAREGMKQNVNPFAKAYMYGRDEPDLNGVGDNIVQVDGYFMHHAKEDAIAMLEEEMSAQNAELWAEMKKDIMDIPHVVTSSSFMNIDWDLNEEDMTYCPEFQFVETQELQDKYRLSEDNDLWWYGCCNPDYPYPTYHIDDTVISARLLSWMQADYNIQGNLYWATDYYSAGNYKDLENYYTDSAVRSTGTNGEGYLFYPGKKYGVDGPLSSIRLEQIRDGLEEAEMILAIREVYKKVSEETGIAFTEETFMRYVYDTMYSGTRVSTTNEVFAQNRKTLIGLLNMAQSDAQVCVTSVAETTDGYTFEVYAKSGYALQYNGQEVSDKRAVANGYLYKVNVSLNSAETFNISVDVDGNVYGVNASFGSSMTLYDAEYLYDNETITENSVSVNQELVAANTVDPSASADAKYLKLKFASGEAANKADRKEHDIIFDDDIIRALDKNADKLIITLYNASSEEITLRPYLEYESEMGIFNTYSKAVLKPGINKITIANLYGFRWSKIKRINTIMFEIGTAGSPAREDIYVVDMCVYMK